MTIKTILNSDMSVAYITDCATSPVSATSPVILLPHAQHAKKFFTDFLVDAAIKRFRYCMLSIHLKADNMQIFSKYSNSKHYKSSKNSTFKKSLWTISNGHQSNYRKKYFPSVGSIKILHRQNCEY
jgi:hypothetical protein